MLLAGQLEVSGGPDFIKTLYVPFRSMCLTSTVPFPILINTVQGSIQFLMGRALKGLGPEGCPRPTLNVCELGLGRSKPSTQILSVSGN